MNNRKAKEYQELLREQVESKQREKEAEKHKLNATKKVEYDEYRQQQYRGKAPNVSTSPRAQGGADRDTGGGTSYDSPRVDRRRNGRDVSPPAYAAGPPDHGEDRYRGKGAVGAPARRAGGGSGRDRDRGREDDGDREPPVRRGGGGNDRGEDKGRRGGGKRGGRGGEDDDDQWVSREEHAELHDLCNRLMERQRELVEEVSLQSEVIEVCVNVCTWLHNYMLAFLWNRTYGINCVWPKTPPLPQHRLLLLSTETAQGVVLPRGRVPGEGGAREGSRSLRAPRRPQPD